MASLLHLFLTLILLQSVVGLTSIEKRIKEDQSVAKTVAKSRRKRSVVFPTGTDLEFNIALQVPISALSATSTTFDVDIPFTYNLPNSTANLIFGGRKIEDEHATVFEMLEDLLNKFGINGKSCLLRLICELSESRGLAYNGLLGKVIETIFLMDYGISTTDRLYEYISAKTYGEHQGDCDMAYPQCPFSAFKLLEHDDLSDVFNIIDNQQQQYMKP